jgi:hypothetical protein
MATDWRQEELRDSDWRGSIGKFARINISCHAIVHRIASDTTAGRAIEVLV